LIAIGAGIAVGITGLASAWAEKEIGKPYVDSLFKAIEATRK